MCMCYEQAFEEDPAASKGGRPLAPNLLLLGLAPEAYMLKQLGSVRAGDLEQALLILPFSDALRLLHYFCAWLERGAEVGSLHRPSAPSPIKAPLLSLCSTPHALTGPVYVSLRHA